RRRHTRSKRDWSSDVCSSDLGSPWLSTFMGASTMFPVHVKATEGPSGAPNILPPANPDSADLEAVQERTTAGERPAVQDGERGRSEERRVGKERGARRGAGGE